MLVILIHLHGFKRKIRWCSHLFKDAFYHLSLGHQELFPVFPDEDEVIGDEKLGMVL